VPRWRQKQSSFLPVSAGFLAMHNFILIYLRIWYSNNLCICCFVDARKMKIAAPKQNQRSTFYKKACVESPDRSECNGDPTAVLSCNMTTVDVKQAKSPGDPHEFKFNFQIEDVQ